MRPGEPYESTGPLTVCPCCLKPKAVIPENPDPDRRYKLGELACWACWDAAIKDGIAYELKAHNVVEIMLSRGKLYERGQRLREDAPNLLPGTRDVLPDEINEDPPAEFTANTIGLQVAKFWLNREALARCLFATDPEVKARVTERGDARTLGEFRTAVQRAWTLGGALRSKDGAPDPSQPENPIEHALLQRAKDRAEEMLTMGDLFHDG